MGAADHGGDELLTVDAPADVKRFHLTPITGLAVIAGFVVLVFVVRYQTSSGPSDHSAAIQSNVGALSCSSSGYQILSKINGDKDTIYNCDMPSGTTICVTEANGIDSNVTATVRLLFANTLGSGKPTCIGG
jgi:hypothetical protein